MQILKATPQDIPAVRELWKYMFDDGTAGFCDFVFSQCKAEDIYIVKNNEKVASMLISMAEMEYKSQKGFYLYSACTHPDYQGKGYMKQLVQYALEDQASMGRSFCMLKPAGETLFSYWKKLGFDNVTQVRKAEVEIKKNIWTNARFDIVTASRFKVLRNKFCNENILHYTPKGYETFAYSHYASGGSTVETEDGYGVYYVEGDTMRFVELMATSTLNAIKILQAARERTGCEKATVYLSPMSDLFLGEGKTCDWCMIKGISDEVYANLPIE